MHSITTSAPRSVGDFFHLCDGRRVAFQRQIGAQLVCETALPGTASHADYFRAGRFGELHVELTADTETKHDDSVAGTNLDAALPMDARRQHLDQRGIFIFDGVRNRKDELARHREIFGKAPVGVAADQSTIRTEIKKAFLTEKTRPAVERGIDQNTRPGFDGIAAFDDFTRDLMTHHARILHGNASTENSEVRSANAGVRDANQHPIGAGIGPL